MTTNYKLVILLRSHQTIVSTLTAVARVTRGLQDENTREDYADGQDYDEAVEAWEEEGEEVIFLEASLRVMAEFKGKCVRGCITHYCEGQDALAIGPAPSATFTALGTDGLPSFLIP